MTNRFQDTISEIRRTQKRLKTAQKTIEKSDAVLAKSVKLLNDGPSYRHAPIPAPQLVALEQAREQVKQARKILRHNESVLNMSAILLKQTGIRPYRKRKPNQKAVAIH